MSKTTLPYSQWQPAITPEQVFADFLYLGDLQAADGNLYWLEGRPAEGGRAVLVRRDARGVVQDITPREYYVRSRVHEYGGGAWALHEDLVVFVNYQDQRLYKQESGKDPVALTQPSGADAYFHKYGGLEIAPDKKHLLCVWEKEHADPALTVNVLATLDLTADQPTRPVELIAGADFYGAPRLSPSGGQIAWTSWNFPYMPWDSTELYIADFRDGGIVPTTIRKVAGGHPVAVLSYQFATNGDLLFVMDQAGCRDSDPCNWPNIYRYRNGAIEAVTTLPAEFGGPQWNIGTTSLATGPDGMIAATYFKDGHNRLVLIDPETKTIRAIDSGLDAYGSLSFAGALTLACIGANAARVPAISTIDLASGNETVVHRSSRMEMDAADIAQAEPVTFPTAGGAVSHAYLYLPKNRRYTAPAGDRPPLLVMAHGGPTSRASGSQLALTKQFWTSQGYAILDVDYRGSSGYGRNYRDALLVRWGIADAEDVAWGVRYLINAGIVHPGRVAITGGSAGGYTVQRVLTMYPILFQAGASYYGIGNLETLARLTHKFESRYLDRLIGSPYTEGDPVYRERSPINHLDKLQAPMILFQGTQDKIVPPETSREMKRILDRKGLNCLYIEYPGEGHGFRSKANNIDALNREAAFYRVVFEKKS